VTCFMEDGCVKSEEKRDWNRHKSLTVSFLSRRREDRRPGEEYKSGRRAWIYTQHSRLPNMRSTSESSNTSSPPAVYLVHTLRSAACFDFTTQGRVCTISHFQSRRRLGHVLLGNQIFDGKIHACRWRFCSVRRLRKQTWRSRVLLLEKHRKGTVC
jgi:hypothetical protein